MPHGEAGLVDLLGALLGPIIRREVRAALQECKNETKPAGLWDRAQTAEFLGFGLTKLDQLVAENVIPSSLIGGKRKFDPEAVRQCVRDLAVRSSGVSA